MLMLLLYQPFFPETDVFTVSYDNVVPYRDPYDLPRVDKLFCGLDVVARRRRVAARVIVDKRNGCGADGA